MTSSKKLSENKKNRHLSFLALGLILLERSGNSTGYTIFTEKNKMKSFLVSLLLLLFTFGSCSKDNGPDEPEEPVLEIRGADMSFLPEVRESGLVVKNASGQQEDMLVTLKNAGVNVIRLRLWKDPETPTSGFATVKALSEEIQGMGMKVMITVHYSDTWADPGHQTKPAQWEGIPYEQLLDSVYAYTAMVAEEIQPEYIQIGNEINGGLLWPEGRYDKPAQMRELLSRGIQAVRDHSPASKIILHFAGHEYANDFFSGLASLDYDIAGISYYPAWHGKNLTQLRQSLGQIQATQGKPVFIAELSYPFTLDWNDYTNNIIGDPSQLLEAYAATPSGQLAYLQKIREIITDVNQGLGFCYWGAEWISYQGPTATNGSAWENQALWNFDARALMGLEAFNE